MSNYLPEKKWMLLIDLAREGKSIREMAEIVKVAKNTARRYYNIYWEVSIQDGHPKPLRKGGFWWHKKHKRG